MMTPEQILDAANRAYHENRQDDWRSWHSLLSVLGFAPDGYGALTHIAQAREEARLRLAWRERDAEQQNYQQDCDEYDEEMSIGGTPFRSLDQ